MELFRCPVCGAPLTRGARVLVCPKRHSFDLAAEGYAHLLPAAQIDVYKRQVPPLKRTPRGRAGAEHGSARVWRRGGESREVDL